MERGTAIGIRLIIGILGVNAVALCSGFANERHCCVPPSIADLLNMAKTPGRNVHYVHWVASEVRPNCW